MSAIRIDLTSELPKARELAEELGKAIESGDVRQLMGRAIAGALKDHFVKLAHDSQHHESASSLGAAPTGFYSEAQSAVQQPNIESDGFSVSINQRGLAQRIFGGPITPTTGTYLTIPARAESYGKRAGEFDNLKFILFPSGLAALVSKDEDAHEGGVYYWLVKSVVQQADPSVLPTEEELTDTAINAARDYVATIWGAAKG